MIWTLLSKDFLRRLRNPGGIIILVLIPLLATLMLGSIFGPGETEGIKLVVKLLIEDHDASMASQFLLGAFSRGELAKMFETEKISAGTGRKRMDNGDASALLIIPTGFGDSLLVQKPVTLTLIKNPSQTFAPKIAEETINVLAEGGDRLVYIAAEPLTQIRTNRQNSTEISDLQISQIAVSVGRLFRKGNALLNPPLIKVKEDTTTSNSSQQVTSPILFAYLLAGMSMMMMLFTLDTLGRDLFREREGRTLFRILVSPASPMDYVASKLLFIFLTGLVSQILLWSAGALLFSIQVNHPLLFLLYLTLCATTLTGVIGLIYALVRTRSQASAILPAVIVVFSMLGGAMVPLHLLPAALKSVSRLSPLFWAIDGIQQILTQNAGLRDLLTHLSVLIFLSIGLNSLAFTLFARKVRG